jgi:uncharacterized membrane protein
MAARIEPLPRPPSPAAGPVYMNATLTPSRSLSARGLTIVLWGMAGASLVSGLVFASLGAWPILGFFGLDVLLLWFALHVARRDGARVRERVVVTAERIEVGRRGTKGPERWWSVSPHFARVEVVRPDEWRADVALAAGPDRLALAHCLSPAERLDFADALRGAIAQARDERHPVREP